uniref:Peptidase S1 domain-containing protein n=1 Tax=Heliothis virescens TaxID=7102 RepID=A0A2A4K113_HELVI
MPTKRTGNGTCAKIKLKRRKLIRTVVGQKAWEKCLEHQSKIKLPCIKGRTISSPYCGQELGTQRAGGINARKHEFAHMALLGYGKNFSEATFGCGGSLISETFVLTAGHCTATRTLVNVTFAVFGILQRQDVPKVSPKNIRRFKRIVKYPLYKPPSVYHDIALLELDKPIQPSYKIRPACLHVGNDIEDIRAYATGWGALGHKRPNANVLQKVPLWRVKDEVCKTKYPPHRVAVKGYDNTTQMCYGDDGIPRDTCKGDSGGPLQISNDNVHCTYLIIGVTSVGLSNCAQFCSYNLLKPTVCCSDCYSLEYSIRTSQKYSGDRYENDVAGGVDARRSDYPHMALLGYGHSPESAEWMCGGSIINDRYILTAGHCMSSPTFGKIRFAALGILQRTDDFHMWQIYDIAEIIPYPQYNPPSKYHDIALLSTRRRIRFNKEVAPACLHRSNVMPRRAIGDSGGPLQIGVYNDKCKFMVAGITSYGRSCGFAGNAGIYTRVAYYMPWIESITGRLL